MYIVLNFSNLYFKNPLLVIRGIFFTINKTNTKFLLYTIDFQILLI